MEGCSSNGISNSYIPPFARMLLKLSFKNGRMPLEDLPRTSPAKMISFSSYPVFFIPSLMEVIVEELVRSNLALKLGLIESSSLKLISELEVQEFLLRKKVLVPQEHLGYLQDPHMAELLHLNRRLDCYSFKSPHN